MKENLVGLLVLLFQDCRGLLEVRAPQVLSETRTLSSLPSCDAAGALVGASLPQPGGAPDLSAGCSGSPLPAQTPGSLLLTCPGSPLPPHSLPGCIRLLQQVSVRSRVIGEAPPDLCLNYGLLLKTCLILFS